MKKIFIILFLPTLFLLPMISRGQDFQNGIGPGSNIEKILPSESVNKGAREQGLVPSTCDDGGCGIGELVFVINEIIRWLIVFATSVVAVMFAYAGFLYITAQGDSNQVKRATGIFRNVAIGFVIILSAFILVRELVGFLVDKDSSLLKLFQR